jgi:glycosyltransferase 2 family protein
MSDTGTASGGPAQTSESFVLEQIERQKAGAGRRAIWMWVPGLLAFVALFVVVAHFSEFEHFLQLAAGADLRWLGVGLVAQALTYICAAGVLWLALSRAGYPLKLVKLTPLGLGKLFADQALPTGGVSGIIFATVGLLNRGVPLRLASFAMLVNIISYYSAYLSAASAGFAVLLLKHRAGPALAAVFAIFATVSVAVPLLVFAVKTWGQNHMPRWLLRFPAVRLTLLEISEAPLAEFLTVRLLLGTYLFQVAIFLLDALTLWIGLRALGVAAEPLVAFTAFVAGAIGATIGPSPLGLGTFEGSAVGTLALLGVAIEPSLTAVLLFRGLSFWLPMLPGLWFARQEMRKSAALAARRKDKSDG